jgi:isopentenyl-diphosphate Delta-isomerase
MNGIIELDKKEKIAHDPLEIVGVVNEQDEVIGNASRKEVHDKGLLHREVYICVINSKKQVLLHKRADVHLWDCSASGHIPIGQDYREAAVREFEEELGIKLNADGLKESGKEKLMLGKGIKNYRFAMVFVVNEDIPIENFKIDKEEVDEIKYFDKDELLEMFSSKDKLITGTARLLIEKYVLDNL